MQNNVFRFVMHLVVYYRFFFFVSFCFFSIHLKVPINAIELCDYGVHLLQHTYEEAFFYSKTMLSHLFCCCLPITSSHSRSFGHFARTRYKCKGRIKSRFMSLIYKLIVVRFLSIHFFILSIIFLLFARRYRKICCAYK